MTNTTTTIQDQRPQHPFRAAEPARDTQQPDPPAPTPNPTNPLHSKQAKPQVRAMNQHNRTPSFFSGLTPVSADPRSNTPVEGLVRLFSCLYVTAFGDKIGKD